MTGQKGGRTQQSPWWKGARGEWFVSLQLVLFAVVLFAPRNPAGWPAWPPPAARIASVAGGFLIGAGALLLLAAIFRLGRNVTPLPKPKPGAPLLQAGPYGIVRHPIYSGGLLMAIGFALVVHGILTLAYAAALLIFLDVKARREERWLTETYPEYGEYSRRVRKLVPFLY